MANEKVDSNKAKALASALAQIEKQFGKGSIMKMSEKVHVALPAVSTGSLKLDDALGIGGLPYGRIVEIYGPESSGKCLVANTRVWSDHGLETIEEVFNRMGQKASTATRVTPLESGKLRLVNESGALEEVSALTHNGKRPTLTLSLSSGRSLCVTQNHPLRVMNEDGFLVWRKAGDMKKDDILVSAAFGSHNQAQGNISDNEAVLLGYLIAEGTLAEKNTVAFSNWDQEVVKEYTSILEEAIAPFSSKKVVHYDDGKEHRLHSKEIRTFFAEKYDMDYAKSAEKKVPNVIRKAKTSVQCAFLSALFEGDGWVEKGGCIGYASASEGLIKDVQLMLLGLGIPNTTWSKFNDIYQRDYWTLRISSGYSSKFMEKIGFRTTRRQAEWERHHDEAREGMTEPFSHCDGIPYLAKHFKVLRDDGLGCREFDDLAGDLFRKDMNLNCSRKRLELCVNWANDRIEQLGVSGRSVLTFLNSLVKHPYTFESIESIQEGGIQPTFDVVMPKTHSFLANGVISHNTTLTLQVLAAAQKEGKTVAFVDAEHALDPIYAEKLGVQVGDLLVSQPDTGEQALEITDTLVRSGAVDVIIIDSVAALVPKAEIDGEMGDSHMGLQARLMSQALRKLAGAAQKNNVLIIFINQIRMKIGVMFGCFHYNARVHLADGTSEKIGKLVNQRRNVEVLSWNSEKQILEPKKIQNWFNNGKAEKFLQITVEGGKSGRRCLPVTENHTIFTPDGEVSAGELSVGDEVLARHHDFIFNEEQMQLLMGSSLGDGSIRKTGFHSASFRFGHGEKQKPYLQWKHDSLRAISSHITQNKKGHVFFNVLANAQAAALKVHLYGDKKGSRKVTQEYLSKMDARAIAVWYMDDGTFGGNYEKWGNGKATLCNRALDSESREFVVDFFEKIGVGRPTLQKNGFQFNSQQTNALHSLIAPYIHPSMDYKLHPSFRGKFNWVVGDDRTLDEMSISRALPSKVIAIYEKPKTRSMNKFDLEIEDNHNYLIDGVVVHNSPETTTGGNALKFYASVRLDIRRTGAIKKGEDIIGNETRIKVVKNKVAPPFKQVEVELLYGEGISKVRELLDYGLDLGVFEKSGAWYSLKEGSERMGQGKENAIEFLKANPQWQDKVEALVRANMVKALKSAPAAQEDDEGLIDE